ncbi:MAG TPA: trypsin-like peptidase domain-containing protein [Rectinemataceae bacterium]|nr:trypsin-like peptidase domain-containing protein [Rectinemataceae bacterium]
MRLYSRGQVILVGLGGVVLSLVLVFALGMLRLPWHGSPAVDATTVSTTAPAFDAGSVSSAPRARLVDSALPEYTTDELENIDVYQRLNEGVVNITTEIVAINWFYEPVPQEGGSGSGSIIDSRGYVLTNNHVVKDATKIYVNLADGGRYLAHVVGVDPENDLAVIKFDPPRNVHLTVIPFGDSSRLKVGQKVLAIGNPFGLERTLTQGIVSGIGRPVTESSDSGTSVLIRDMIQTDASINPGNSGGPLLDAHGEMIGVNTMIYSPSGGSVGIGFAVPVDTAKRVVPDLIRMGKVRRGWIQVDSVQLFPELIDFMKQNGYAVPVSSGLLVSRVTRGGNADQAGIRGGETPVRYGRSSFNVGGDIIVSVNGMKTTTITDLYSALENTKPGERIPVEFYRGDKRLSVDIVLSDRAKAGVVE